MEERFPILEPLFFSSWEVYIFGISLLSLKKYLEESGENSPHFLFYQVRLKSFFT